MFVSKRVRFIPCIVLISFLLSLFAATGILGAHRAFTRTARNFRALTRAGASTTAIATRTTGYPMHRRQICSAANLKGFTDALKPTKQHLAPSRGAPFAETEYYFPNVYEYGSPLHPLAKLIRALFYKQDTQFRPTQNKSNPAYALTPQLLGHLISLIEDNALNDAKKRQELFTTWKKEYAALTSDKISNAKVESFLQLVSDAAAHDKTQTINILLGFLYHKANDKKDLAAYVNALQKQSPVLSNELAPAFVDDNFDTDNILAQPLRTNKDSMSQMLTTQFDGTVAKLITERKKLSIYPPDVIQSNYGYNGQPSRPNCVETAFNGMYNILLYDTTTHSFDLNLLPKAAVLNDQFKQFYTTICTPETVNSPAVGQAFMNMVSDIPGIKYESNKNYELEAASCEQNFLQLTNRFFGLNAQNYDELGQQLSTDKRAVKFKVKKRHCFRNYH
jgi:hypothetical protein